MSSLFPGTREHRASNNGVEIFARVGGSGPPLLLLHGFPQTHAMWHRVAPRLMQQYTCVLPDLRGYGFSACPANDERNFAYSKRAMGQDMLVLMQELGHPRFAVVGHDRGGRVAYRMALDQPEAIAALGVLDIVPTYAMWHKFTVHLAMKTYHWLFLAQPNPLPEMLIEQAPISYLDYTMASWTKSKNLSAFAEEALAEYRLHYATPEHIHATCNDYRAGATFDLAADVADRAAERKIACPTLVVWGDTGIPSETEAPLATWHEWCESCSGAAIASGHFVAEENPQGLLDHLLPFLATHAH
ncbi:MAG: alpha/beta hydrolase [Rhizobiales bacterium]|nr:alpha/beta hydrolase [Hyphomicrobiales bacterium]MBI3673501.1 alpha/beta hydrolase [Hyphomicrobiales bacterium]